MICAALYGSSAGAAGVSEPLTSGSSGSGAMPAVVCAVVSVVVRAVLDSSDASDDTVTAGDAESVPEIASNPQPVSSRRVIAVREDSLSDNSTVSNNRVLQDVRGQTLENAKAALETEGFVVQTAYEASDSVESGYIIQQDPVPGSRIPEGYTVVLTVSSGTGDIEVPSMVGNTAAEAKVALENLGLTIQLTDAVSDTVPQGSVVSQSPDAGTMVAPGSTVIVAVNTGKSGATD